MKQYQNLTCLLIVLLAFPIFGQVITPFTVTSTDTSICVGQSTTLSVQALQGTFTSLICTSAVNTGNLFSGAAATGVSSSIPYSGGNGGLYSSQTVISTGVTGLTATLSAGVFNSGSGNLVYSIIGTPSATGVASFTLTIGGQTCTLTLSVYGTQPNYPLGSVFCNGITTIVNEVTNPTTGKIWMDRNLGASQVASSSSDANSFGDLYQWGRGNDGHQCRNSTITSVLSSTDEPGHGNFIVSSMNIDWRSSENANLWQWVNGVNNPCPAGYRLPSQYELISESYSWNVRGIDGAIASPLKIPPAGKRWFADGSFYSIGYEGVYWSNTISGSDSKSLSFEPEFDYLGSDYRSNGFSVRCLKDVIATVAQLKCSSIIITGTLKNQVAANGVSVNVPYTGGNGGSYSGQTILSTGVLGLIATLPAGVITNNSSLTYTISGTPTSSGTANFPINLGGQSCSFSLDVSINYALQYPNGFVFCGLGPSAVFDVTNPTTGKTWMDRNLGASRVATSSTDENAYGELYQWGRRSDGHQCRSSATIATLSSVNQPTHGYFITTSIIPIDWRSPQNTNLWQGVNGVNNPCPFGYRLPTEPELTSEMASWVSQNSTGAYASVLKLTLTGARAAGGGSIPAVGVQGYLASSTISGESTREIVYDGSASMHTGRRATGYTVRCIKETIGSIGALNCGSSAVTGNLISGTAASGVSASIPYTSGNGGFYPAQNISSTGVTGLTATIIQSLFASGSGNLVYSISGTPNASGNANFAVNIGGKSCTLSIIVYGVQPTYPVGSVFCNGATIVNDVTNPTTGKTWMDRNLGASQVATSSTDANAYGDLYQWGRRSDGHQCRSSATTTALSYGNQPTHGNFILAPNTPIDWRSPQNDNLWQGVNGVNNPCPFGYRLPTEPELTSEMASWVSQNSTGAYASVLKLTLTGARAAGGGSIPAVGVQGYVASSTISGVSTREIVYDASAAIYTGKRATGYAVRCIKETIGSIGALNCVNSTVTGNLIAGAAASGVSVSVPYTGGNGGYYTAQSVVSTGVTGLTATISQGLFTSGAGNLTYAITGTSSASGTASFALNIGGKTCNLNITIAVNPYPAGTVFCNQPTLIVDVTNPTTGKTWMDRNLDGYYQWGRRSDGHQCQNSPTTETLSSVDQPVDGKFIIIPSQTSPNDWRSPQNNNLWQGVNGVNNPCPSGYRIPTNNEWADEIATWTEYSSVANTAYNSTLRLSIGGARDYIDGSYWLEGEETYFWSSTIDNTSAGCMYLISAFGIGVTYNARAAGSFVRCIKD